MTAPESAPGGVFTISLDFELYWGVRDRRTIEDYGANLRGVRNAIRRMLELFTEYDVHATWATVGFLFCRDLAELRQYAPAVRPRYTDSRLSPYTYIEAAMELDPVYHFAPEMIELLRATPGQEIATHTFSHYYCLEAGQDVAAFRADLQAAVSVARARGITLRTIVFPRNQWSSDYVQVLDEFGITAFRVNEDSPYYPTASEDGQSRFRRAVRLVDAYVNVTGHHTYTLDRCGSRPPFAVPSSRFLRPFSPAAAALEPLRLRRISRAMTDAAVQGRVYHLWWHPHNFGVHTDENIAFLSQVLAQFAAVRARYGMQSLNMGEVAALLSSTRVPSA